MAPVGKGVRGPDRSDQWRRLIGQRGEGVLAIWRRHDRADMRRWKNASRSVFPQAPHPLLSQPSQYIEPLWLICIYMLICLLQANDVKEAILIRAGSRTL